MSAPFHLMWPWAGFAPHCRADGSAEGRHVETVVSGSQAPGARACAPLRFTKMTDGLTKDTTDGGTRDGETHSDD